LRIARAHHCTMLRQDGELVSRQFLPGRIRGRRMAGLAARDVRPLPAPKRPSAEFGVRAVVRACSRKCEPFKSARLHTAQRESTQRLSCAAALCQCGVGFSIATRSQGTATSCPLTAPSAWFRRSCSTACRARRPRSGTSSPRDKPPTGRAWGRSCTGRAAQGRP